MKKFILGLLLVTIIAATLSGSNCNCGCHSGSCDCGNDPSFPVNQEVCIKTPSYVKPPSCLIPEVDCPEVCAPEICPPEIEKPEIEVCQVETPDVVKPPRVKPPTVIIPDAPSCDYPPPPPPPQVPDVCDPVLPPVPPIVYRPPPPQFDNDKLTRKFKLSFRYFCRMSVPFLSCQANVLWNNVIIASLNPTHYGSNVLNIVIEVSQGQNRLQIEGTGISDSFGLIIDNVRLRRDGTNVNIVINGGFSQPDVSQGWGIFNDIKGWDGKGIEIGYGNIYVQNGYSSQVAELDGHRNYQITQRYFFDSDYKLTNGHQCEAKNFPGKFLVYKLEFQYAARAGKPASTSFANVLWNNIVIASITPQDHQVHTKVLYVELVAGNNILQFDGASNSDSFGLTIDNVKLTSKYDSYNLIKNGGFENPNQNGGWSFVDGGIYGWAAQKAEVGHCKNTYNANWPSCNGQCIELDSTKNQRYTQVINISQKRFTYLYVKMSTIEGDAAVKDHICSATGKAHNDINNAVAKLHGDIYCQIKLTAHNFNKYICDLYKTVGQEVKDVKADELLTLSQYDCLSDAYVGRFGKSYEVDFDDGYFNPTNLKHWEGYIEAINGKIIRCRDKYGRRHYLQIAPCTHFEGQFPLPVLNQKIYWKGAQSSCGKTYVKYATTCNC